MFLLRMFETTTPPQRIPNHRVRDYEQEVEEITMRLAEKVSEPYLRDHWEMELEKYKNWSAENTTLLNHARGLSGKDNLQTCHVAADGNCLLYATNVAHKEASANNCYIMEDDDLRILAATLAREWTLSHAHPDTRPLLLQEIDEFIRDGCAFNNEPILQALASIRNGQINTIGTAGNFNTHNPNAAMRNLLLDNPGITPTCGPIYLLNRLVGSAHYDATKWPRPAPPEPPRTHAPTPQKRNRPQQPTSESPPTLRPRFSPQSDPPAPQNLPFEDDDLQDQQSNHELEPPSTGDPPLPHLEPPISPKTDHTALPPPEPRALRTDPIQTSESTAQPPPRTDASTGTFLTEANEMQSQIANRELGTHHPATSATNPSPRQSPSTTGTTPAPHKPNSPHSPSLVDPLRPCDRPLI